MSHNPHPAPDKLSVIAFSGEFERLHYALVLASASAAANIPATLFFAMAGTRALLAGTGDRPGWRALPAEGGRTGGEADDELVRRGVGGFEELLMACAALKVRFIVCEMGLKALGIEFSELRDDLPLERAGVITLLSDASRDGAMVLI